MKELNLYPTIFRAKYANDSWTETFVALDNLTAKEQQALTPAQQEELLAKRNAGFSLPLISATSQYGYSVFEGGKAFPQADGSVKIFRPDQNGQRMEKSLIGLKMIPMAAEKISEAMCTVIAKNYALGYMPNFEESWVKDDFLSASAVYIRPFTYASAGIWPVPDPTPWLIITVLEVGSLFDASKPVEVIVSNRTRAIKGGTGSIKCTANYTVSILAKQEALAAGFNDALFLDAEQRKYVEEGSVSNFFCLMKNGELVTPALTDTILPGITRKSILELAPTLGIKVSERPLELEEVLHNGVEAFACGTAAAITHISAITHQGKRYAMGNQMRGEVTALLSKTYRGIQYGTLQDQFNWMKTISI